MESGIFGFLMKNRIDSAKNIRVSPKFAFRGQTDSSVGIKAVTLKLIFTNIISKL